MTAVYIISSLVAIGFGFMLGSWHTADKYRASRRADKPAEIHSAVKPSRSALADLDVPLSGVRGRGW